MPILNTADEVTNVDTITPDRKLYTNPDLKTSTLFNKDQELNDIIQYVEGSKWTVDYFQQVREINTPAVMPDINDTSTIVNYNRISKLIIYIDGAISQDDPNNITGTARINAGYLPSYGDPFIATLTGRREAIFVITNVEKKLYSLHEMYNVEFKLFAFLDKDSIFYRDLISKVVKEYIYDASYIKDKSAPIILAKDYKDKLNFKNTLRDLIDYYFKNMYNPEKSIISLPTITGVTYLDTMLTDFLYKLVGYTNFPNANKLNRFDDTAIVDYSIYDMLLYKDLNRIDFLHRDMGFTYIPNSVSLPVMRHIGWLGIDWMVGELNGEEPVDITVDIKVNTITKPSDYISPSNINTTEHNYLFSEFFYNQDTDNCSVLENLVLQYLKDEVVDQEKLSTLLSQYKYWETEEQFYYIPILMIMVKDVINNTFSAI